MDTMVEAGEGRFTPLVSTRFMSSPEHCRTSMYLFLLPMNMNFLCLLMAAASAESSESIWMKASPEGVPCLMKKITIYKGLS